MRSDARQSPNTVDETFVAFKGLSPIAIIRHFEKDREDQQTKDRPSPAKRERTYQREQGCAERVEQPEGKLSTRHGLTCTAFNFGCQRPAVVMPRMVALHRSRGLMHATQVFVIASECRSRQRRWAPLGCQIFSSVHLLSIACVKSRVIAVRRRLTVERCLKARTRYLELRWSRSICGPFALGGHG